MTESSTPAAAAAMVMTDASSVVTSVISPATPSASAAVASTEMPLVDVSDSTASPAVTPAVPVADTATKSKTPQTRKSRSRIAANFGALNPQ